MASSRRNLFLSILLCPVFCFSLVASGRCFWIDGTEVINRFPCYDLNSVGASMCCDSTLRDYFVGCDHGICVFNFTQGVEGPNDEGSSFWRDSCTDPTWMDPACLAMAPGKPINSALDASPALVCARGGGFASFFVRIFNNFFVFFWARDQKFGGSPEQMR